jgi:dUTP pyrophosphatase
MIKYCKLSPKATTPSLATPLSAGYDLYSAYEYIVPAKGKELIKTDIAVQIPSDYYGRVAPRSGLAWSNFIDVGAGVIDADYRGDLRVLLFNFSDKDFKVNKGDRVAQLIIQKIIRPEFIEIKLDQSSRGAGGFGSTGK